jgi:hypothetical protein
MINNVRHRILICCLAVAVSATVLIAPVAGAHPAPRTTSSSAVTFYIQQPAGSTAAVKLSGGISNITSQTVGGTSIASFSALTNGFMLVSGGGTQNVGSVSVVGQITPGTPITGSATLPTGTTMSVSINNGPKQTINSGDFSIPAPGVSR